MLAYIRISAVRMQESEFFDKPIPRIALILFFVCFLKKLLRENHVSGTRKSMYLGISSKLEI